MSETVPVIEDEGSIAVAVAARPRSEGFTLARWIMNLRGGDIRVERRVTTGGRMPVVLPAGSR